VSEVVVRCARQESATPPKLLAREKKGRSQSPLPFAQFGPLRERVLGAACNR
jgi:hypothetical protein